MNQTAFKKLANNATLKGFNKGVLLYFKLKQAIVQYIYNINFSSNRLEFYIRLRKRSNIFILESFQYVVVYKALLYHRDAYYEHNLQSLISDNRF